MDEAVSGLDARVPESITDRVPLLGADGYRALWNQRRSLAAAAGIARGPRSSTCSTVTAPAYTSCWPCCGTIRRWRRRCPARTTTCRSRRVYAVTHEGARHLDDVLARRTRISIEAWDRGVAAAPTVAALMAGPLGWDEEQTNGRSSTTWRRVARRTRLPDQARRRHGRSGPPGCPRHRRAALTGGADRRADRRG